MMNNIFRATSLILAASFGVPSTGIASDIENGRSLARKCSVCHGKLGVAKDPEMPNLAGQSALYLEKSMKDFRSGAREDRRMSLMAQTMSDEEIADLAAWFASIKFTVEEPE